MISLYPFVMCFSFLAKRGVKEEIQTFDARKIAPEIRQTVEKLLQKNKDSFEVKVMYRYQMSPLCQVNWY